MRACPFCGNSEAPEVMTEFDLEDECCCGDDCHSDEIYAVVCCDQRGGCGAMGGYRPSIAKALIAWKNGGGRRKH